LFFVMDKSVRSQMPYTRQYTAAMLDNTTD